MAEVLENQVALPPEVGDSTIKALLSMVARLSGASSVHLAVVPVNTGQRTRVFTHPDTPPPSEVPTTMKWVISHGAPLIMESPLAANSILGLPGKPQGPFPLICVPLPQRASPKGALQLHFSSSSSKLDLPSLLETLQLLAQEIQSIWHSGALSEEPLADGELAGRRNRGLLDALDRERQRISEELHDGVLQNLIIALRYLRTLKEHSTLRGKDRQLTGEASVLLEETIRESRGVIDSLASKTSTSFPLVASLRQELKRVGKAEGIKTRLIAQEVEISKEKETALYWMASEAIANAIKHSATTRLQVTLKRSQDQIVLEVKDWGVGFDPQVVSLRKGKNLGLPNLHRQAQRLGGDCQIKSSPSKGTTVRVTLPL